MKAQEAFKHDPDGAGPRRHRRRGRGHQPPARPPDGQLRPAVEPQPPRAALRPHPPHRPDRGLPPLEPGRRGDARGRGLPHAAGEAGGGAPGARRPGLRRPRQAAVRGQAAARPADRGDPLRRPARGPGPADPGRRARRSTASQLQDCSKSARWPTTRWTPAASSAIREDMERAEARRLQPHYIESFFLEAFKQLGGTAKQREPRRYEITHVPGRRPQPRPPDRHRRAGPAALRADRLREGPHRARRASRWPRSSAPAIRCWTRRST